MALLPLTGLETHNVGSDNIAGIINANWTAFEAIAAVNGWHRPALATIAYAASVNADFWGAKTQYLALTGDVTVAFTNLAAGRDVTLLITADASLRNLTWPASVKWLGTAPATLAAGKSLRVHFFSRATTAADVWAHFQVEP